MDWMDVGARDLLPAGGMMEAEAGPVALLLYDVAGAVFATAAVCPHHAAWLSQGQISGTAIDCPRHMGRFDIATGRKLRGPDCPDLAVYPVRVVAGRMQVRVG
jgi:nitrite reductase/ring-hydroxylating ferredoxin subunit